MTDGIEPPLKKQRRQACTSCGTEVQAPSCDRCGSYYCGLHFAAHQVPCATCGAAVCGSVPPTCPCNAHFCAIHAAAHPVACTTCGALFCSNTVEYCLTCNAPFCGADAGGHPLACSACNENFCPTTIQRCLTCNAPFCGADAGGHPLACSACNQNFCPTAIQRCATCNAPFCGADAGGHPLACSACNENFCPTAIQRCATCNAPFCGVDAGGHPRVCSSCNQNVCPTAFVACTICPNVYCAVCTNQHPHQCGDCTVAKVHTDMRVMSCLCTVCNACVAAHQKTCSKCNQPACRQTATDCTGCAGRYCDDACWPVVNMTCVQCVNSICATCWPADAKCPWGCATLDKSKLALAAKTLPAPSAYTRCDAADKTTRTAHLFERVNPRQYLTTTSKRGKVDDQVLDQIWNKLSDDKVVELLLNDTLRPGPYSLGYQPVPAEHLASTSATERQKIQVLGAKFHCHTCNAATPAGNAAWGTWIADHQPPKSLKLPISCFKFEDSLTPFKGRLTTAATKAEPIAASLAALGAIRLYPHCGACSLKQSGLVSRANALVGNVQSHRKNAGSSAPVLTALEEALVKLGETLEEAVKANLIRLAHDAAASTDGTLLPATAKEKAIVQQIGGMTDANNNPGKGCHSCGLQDPKLNAAWIADHQPPTALHSLGLRRDPKQYLYPQCIPCSTKQSGVTNAIARQFSFLKPDHEIQE